MIAGAAVFAARTARESALERQEAQLAHDTRRQEIALEHDRKMRDRESTRLAIDGAMRNLSSVLRRFSDLEVTVKRIQANIDDPEQSDAASKNKKIAVTELSDTYIDFAELMFDGIRLASRNETQRLAGKFEEIRENYNAMRKILGKGMTEKLNDADFLDLQEVNQRGTTLIGEAHQEWNAWLDDE